MGWEQAAWSMAFLGVWLWGWKGGHEACKGDLGAHSRPCDLWLSQRLRLVALSPEEVRRRLACLADCILRFIVQYVNS